MSGQNGCKQRWLWVDACYNLNLYPPKIRVNVLAPSVRVFLLGRKEEMTDKAMRKFHWSRALRWDQCLTKEPQEASGPCYQAR